MSKIHFNPLSTLELLIHQCLKTRSVFWPLNTHHETSALSLYRRVTHKLMQTIISSGSPGLWETVVTSLKQGRAFRRSTATLSKHLTIILLSQTGITILLPYFA